MWRISNRRPVLKSILVGCVIGALMARWVRAAEQTKVTAPTQPESGPGGSDYVCDSVVKSNFGEGNGEFWIFEPADSKPAKAPVILFMHGWSAMNPAPYTDWINHIVRRGNIVIYPRYQAKLTTKPGTFTPNAIAAIKQALTILDQDNHVHPDRDKVAVVGHSFGGIIAANLAADAGSELPPLKAVMCVEPGNGGFPVNADYSKIPPKTLLLCVAGDEDKLVKDTFARRIFTEATAVDNADKNYILVSSDSHGTPALIANHMAPVAQPGSTNAMDWYGFWKWYDGLTDAAFYGKNRQYALGNTAEQRFMGKWSDGQPVAEPVVTEAK
jgi:dienelactone hydrolase